MTAGSGVEECDAVFEASGSHRRVALILDASESASDKHSQVRALAQYLIDGLPARTERSVFFLGNPSPYAAGRLMIDGAAWFEQNSRRASLLLPVLASKSIGPDDHLIIIGSGRVFDIEDCDLIRGSALLAHLGESLQYPHEIAPELPCPSPSQLLAKVYDPITKVRLAGTGFMPVWWDNAGYSLVQKGQEWSLVWNMEAGDRTGTDPTVRLRYLIAASETAEAGATCVSGASHVHPLAHGQVFDLQNMTGTLTPEETEIFRLASADSPFTCRYGGEHKAGDLVCYHQSSILGEPVYWSAAAAAMDQQSYPAFVLMRLLGEVAEFIRLPGAVLQLNADSVAILEKGQPFQYDYKPSSRSWVRAKPLPPYFLTREGWNAVVLG